MYKKRYTKKMNYIKIFRTLNFFANNLSYINHCKY